MENSVLGPLNQFVQFADPTNGVARRTFNGSPLGVTTTGELGMKVIVLQQNEQPNANNPDVVTFGQATPGNDVTIPQGTDTVNFQASDDFVGTVNNNNVPAGTTMNLTATRGNVLPAFNLVATAGSISYTTQTPS